MFQLLLLTVPNWNLIQEAGGSLGLGGLDLSWRDPDLQLTVWPFSFPTHLPDSPPAFFSFCFYQVFTSLGQYFRVREHWTILHGRFKPGRFTGQDMISTLIHDASTLPLYLCMGWDFTCAPFHRLQAVFSFRKDRHHSIRAQTCGAARTQTWAMCIVRQAPYLVSSTSSPSILFCCLSVTWRL